MLRHLTMILVGSAALAACSAASAGSEPAPRQGDSAIERGRRLAAANCAQCHAVGTAGESAHPKAPPFRLLPERYPTNLEEALTEGVAIGHPEMPPAGLDSRQIDDLVAYLRSLR